MSVFATESELCAAFMAWARRNGYRVFPETAGWDIVLVDKDGFQIGIEAKKQLNLKVLQQAMSGTKYLNWLDRGPDHRAILVPDSKGISTALSAVGIEVFELQSNHKPLEFRDCSRFGEPFFDWNPQQRLELPPVEFEGAAGVPAPKGMTEWKQRALRLIALLETRGHLTRRDFEDVRMSSTRWMAHGEDGRWLVPGQERGQWVRGSLPRFEEGFPDVYAHILGELRAKGGA